MPTRAKGFHHLHIRKRMYQKHEPYPHPDKLKRMFDKFIYVIVILGPIVNLPQLFKIWVYQNATGVSLVSWAGFSVISMFWLVYGLLHKEKPIILMNVALMIVQAMIAL